MLLAAFLKKRKVQEAIGAFAVACAFVTLGIDIGKKLRGKREEQ